MSELRAWSLDGWTGWCGSDDAMARSWLAASASGEGRRSRHARTLQLGEVYVKRYPAPAGPKALHAWRMGETLRAAGFAVPVPLLAATHAAEGILVTRDVGGDDLLAYVAGLRAAPQPTVKRRLLARLGREVARLHNAGFVHGDLVPSNVRVVGEGLVWLDHDRSRHSHLLVRFSGRRNLVQLGRFVVPGLSTVDRWRVLAAYAGERGWSARARQRLGRWLASKIVARRCRIDHLSAADATRAGFRAVMRSGGPFDAGRAGGTP